MKTFKVNINIEATYYAEDEEECEELIHNDFSNLEITDVVTIKEVKGNDN